MIQTSRCFHLLHHFQNKIDELTPSPQTVLKFREQLATEASSQELKDLLELEYKLSDERKALQILIEEVKNNEKKKAFACATQKLVVIEKKLKETSKQLNHRLMESDYVVTNLDKVMDVVNWMKQRIEQDANLVLSGENDDTLLETVIQKKEKMILHESKLNDAISLMRRDEEEVEVGEKNLETVKKRIDCVRAELEVYRNGTDPTLVERYRNLKERKETAEKVLDEKESKMKEKIAKLKDRLRRDTEAYEQKVRDLRDIVQTLEDELILDEENHLKETQELAAKCDDANKLREENLKELLQIRMKWNKHEEELEEIKREKEKLQDIEMRDRERREAVELIKNRLTLLYKSKYQNRRESQTKKSQSKRKKKK